LLALFIAAIVSFKHAVNVFASLPGPPTYFFPLSELRIEVRLAVSVSSATLTPQKHTVQTRKKNTPSAGEADTGVIPTLRQRRIRYRYSLVCSHPGNPRPDIPGIALCRRFSWNIALYNPDWYSANVEIFLERLCQEPDICIG